MDIDSPLERKIEDERRQTHQRALDSIPLELTLADSPKLHYLIYTAEMFISDLSRWLDESLKSSLMLSRSSDRYLDAHIESSKVFTSELDPALQIDRSAIQMLTSNWSKIEKLQRQLNIDTKNMISATLSKLLEEDFKSLNEEKRKLEKFSEKYHSILTRYSSLSPKKETGILEEESYILYSSRESYLKQSLEYVKCLKKILNTVEITCESKFFEFLTSEMSYYEKCAEYYKSQMDKIDSMKSSIENNKESYQKRIASIDSKSNSLKDVISTIYHPTREVAAEQAQTSREGYLWRRSKKQGVIFTWIRSYFTLSNSTLSYRSFTQERGFVGRVISNNISTCKIRVIPMEKIDRRFCFEIIADKDQWILQAESEREMKIWVGIIENYQLNSEDNSLAGSRNTNQSFVMSMGNTPEEFVTSYQAENLKTSESLKYPLPIFEEKNMELHKLMKSIPENDYVFDAETCANQREILIHGKLYATQNRIIFYSSIMKIVKIQVIYYADVLSIESRDVGLLKKTLEVSTANSKYVFTFFRFKDIPIRDAIKKLWKIHKGGSQTDISLTQTQELYDSMYKSYLKELEKEGGEEGSDEELASLAEDKQETDTSGFDTPTSVTLPASEISPEHEALNELLLNEVFSIPVQKLYSMITDNEDPALIRFHDKRNNSDLKWEAWKNNAEGKPERIFYYKTPVTAPIGKGTVTPVTETQICLVKEDYCRYLIDTLASTPEAPYGDFFVTHVRYYLTFVNKTSCRLQMTLQVDFKKSTALRGFIRTGVLKSCQGLAKDLSAHIKKEIKSSGKPKAEKGEETTEAGAEGDTKEAEESSEEKVENKSSSMPMWMIAVIVVLVISLILNVYFVLQPKPKIEKVSHLELSPVLQKFSIDHKELLNGDKTNKWWSPRQKEIGEKYVSMGKAIKDLRQILSEFDQVFEKAELTIIEAQVIGISVDSVEKCYQESASKNHTQKEISDKCLKQQFLLKNLLKEILEN